MNWDELLGALGILDRDIKVKVIKPLRKDDYAKTGRVTGFKCGRYGGGHYNYQRRDEQHRSAPYSFDSSRMHWIKKPKVHVTYNAFEYGKKEYSDWIEVDNCEFELD